MRVRAPELRGRGWLNTGGADVSLAGLRGKIVLLDFWTSGCINCLHVLDELRPLEEKYADVLVTVGVHSPKFAHEADADALAAAVERYDVHHPVLDDPELTTWQQYAVRAWPTLVVVDPEGYVVAQMSGEGHAHSLDILLADLVAEHDGEGHAAPRRRTLRRAAAAGDRAALPRQAAAVAGRHVPGLRLRAPLAGRARGRRPDRAAPDRLGRPRADRTARQSGRRSTNRRASACSRRTSRDQVGYDVLVADTVNHALRGVRLDTGESPRSQAPASQWMQGDPVPAGSDRAVALSSPWDVAWHDGHVSGRDGRHPPALVLRPLTRALAVRRRHDATRDCSTDHSAEAWFAQTSGLATAADGTLWMVDPETSSLRSLSDGQVRTAVGTGLFDFGHVDGPAEKALLQHPLGVAVLPDGSIAVCDTYNGAIRRYDPATAEVSTLAVGLAEPSDAAVVDGDLLVVESAAHRLTRVRLPEEALVVDAVAHRTARPQTEVPPGEVLLEVVFVPPRGQKLDDRDGPATRLVVTATPPGLLRYGEGRGTELTRLLVLDEHVGDGVLHVAAMAASCDDDAAVEFPACHIHQQDWGVPVRLVAGAEPRLTLMLHGVEPADAR